MSSLGQECRPEEDWMKWSTNIFSYLYDQNLRVGTGTVLITWFEDRKCQKMCLHRRIHRLYCLDEWIILISISELSQEVGRICMLRTGIKGSAVDFLQVGTTTLAIYFTMLAFYCVHLLWAILFWKLCQLHWYGANATSKEDKCIWGNISYP